MNLIKKKKRDDLSTTETTSSETPEQSNNDYKELSKEELKLRAANLMLNDIVDKKEEDVELENMLYSDKPFYEPYDNFPNVIKKQIKKYSFFAIGFIAVSVASIVIGYVNFYILIPLFIVLAFLLYKGIILYETVRRKDYTIFSGVIISCQRSKFGVFKNSPKSIIQISDGDKTLSCSISQRKLSEGNLITLFIEKEEPIYQSDEGPYVKNYLAVAFSANDADSVEDYLKQDKIISAEDYINSED